MTEAAQTLHGLLTKRKTLLAVVKEKNSILDHSISNNINSQRAQDRNKRIEIYGKIEDQRQQITSALMLELIKICEKDEVPRYIVAIAKILDNYQGKLASTLQKNYVHFLIFFSNKYFY